MTIPPALRLVAAAPRRPYARTFEARRERILACAWEMIAERGGDGFSLAELGERAGVAVRTIYNAFTDRDGVVAQAVATHYRSLFGDPAAELAESRSLAESLAMIDTVVAEIVRVRGWAITGAQMYFSARTSPRIVDSLRAMPLLILKGWLRSAEADRRQLALLGREEVMRSFANAQWALTSDWAAGRIDVAELAQAMKRNLIVLALAFGTTAGRAEGRRLGALLA
ncbi:TetR/AcrR family transcriptional regulator [Sphingomonas profundi]|uniref:TetR/AcrR family transcriptional regulator n=1 Tax=Alterirhizorhabdus profundi TaxID=2681549 RepID=UPI0012E951BB|nr:TetR/AcrR family transcriptional regulator [Sphingomonas profundi]